MAPSERSPRMPRPSTSWSPRRVRRRTWRTLTAQRPRPSEMGSFGFRGRPPAALEGLLRELSAKASGYLRWINASQGQTVRVITVDDVCYFQADSKYTRVVTSEGESLIRKPIKELTHELDPTSFWQIHRSTIVNVHAIAGVLRDLRGRTQVRLKRREELLQVSDAYTQLFRQM